jgi:hypothetical protein
VVRVLLEELLKYALFQALAVIFGLIAAYVVMDVVSEGVRQIVNP